MDGPPNSTDVEVESSDSRRPLPDWVFHRSFGQGIKEMGSRKLRRYFRNEVLERSGLTDWQLGRAISIGLVNRPLGQKRGSYYTEEHIEQARLVARQLAQGCTYIQMKQALKRGLRPAAEL